MRFEVPCAKSAKTAKKEIEFFLLASWRSWRGLRR